MEAKEARKIAEQINADRIDVEYEKCKSEIIKAANSGKLFVMIYNPISSDVQMLLESEGYKVSMTIERNETQTEIHF